MVWFRDTSLCYSWHTDNEPISLNGRAGQLIRWLFWPPTILKPRYLMPNNYYASDTQLLDSTGCVSILEWTTCVLWAPLSVNTHLLYFRNTTQWSSAGQLESQDWQCPAKTIARLHDITQFSLYKQNHIPHQKVIVPI